MDETMTPTLDPTDPLTPAAGTPAWTPYRDAELRVAADVLLQHGYPRDATAVRAAVAEIERLQKELADLQMRFDAARLRARAHCQHCGWTDIERNKEDAAILIQEHVTRCAKHPMRALEVARDAEKARADRLQAFKDWVHAYLNSHGVPHHPPGTHGAEGCRIGDRMDWLMADRDRLKKCAADRYRAIEKLTKDGCDFEDELIQMLDVPPSEDDAGEIFKAVKELKQDRERLTRELAAVREKVRYWSYCTYQGMRKWCPEKEPEFLGMCRSLDIQPYADVALLAGPATPTETDPVTPAAGGGERT